MPDSSVQGRADEVVRLLVEGLPGFALVLLDTQTSPQAAMAHWLMTQEPPHMFSADRETELKAADESKATVRYARRPLDIDQVREHIEHGKLPTKKAGGMPPEPFDETAWLLTAKRTALRGNALHPSRGSQQCKELATKARWLDVQTQEIKKVVA